MLKYIKEKTVSTKSFCIFIFLFLLIAKICVIILSYSYAFWLMDWKEITYYVFSVIQSDLLILWLILILVFWITHIKNWFGKSLLFLIIGVISALYLADILVILFFQQRLILTSWASYLTAWSWVFLFYVLVFLLCIAFLVLSVQVFLWLTRIRVSNTAVVVLLVFSFLIYGFPFPVFHFSWVELPEWNILASIITDSYTFYISWEKDEVKNNLSEVLDVPEVEMQFLLKKKQWWFALAHDDPERIFDSFNNSSLTKLTDEYWNDYVFDVLAEATRNEPELAFKYIDEYKDWKDKKWKTIVKDLLRVAIQTNPELAFRNLDTYQNFVEDHEKIAKSLLQYAVQMYKAPLTFDQLFTEVQWRKNKSNVILVFLESASSVDSRKFWGLNDRLPWLDNVSNDWTSFLNMHANGMTSDMGHIATLLWVEPLEYDYKWTRYESFTGIAAPLATFFNKLWYSTTFLSAATLEFLNQRDFLKNVWYQTIIWEEAFEDKPKYTFDAAPDADLYEKAIEVVKAQTWSFFLTFQTISSHTPYNTPYGRSMEWMYRYEDETFSKFYEDLKATNFFDNGILIVIWDHRKMTSLEDKEFAKWWTTAAAKIIWFMVGKWVPSNKLANGIYQQTDLFYSILHEFWSWTVEVLENYNDLFSKEISRKRSIKQRYEEKKMNIADTAGHEWVIDLTRMKMMNGEEYFPVDDILNYVRLSMDFQKESHWMKTDDNAQKNRTILIAHRGITKKATENSIDAFSDAYDAWAEGIEMDVSATKDGQLIVFHGPKLYNKTKCKQEQRDVCNMNWDEVQKCLLDDGQEIMLLEDVLPKIKDWFRYVFLDFKIWEGESCPQNKWKVFEEVLTLVQKNKMDAKVIFSSYDENVSKFLWTKWNIISALDTYSLDRLDDIPWSYFSYFMTPSENFTDTLIQKLERYMVDGVAYIVNDVQTAKNLQSLGVRFMITDEIELLRNWLKQN